MKKNIAIGAFIGGNYIACAAVDLTTRKIIQGTSFKASVENFSSSGLILSLWTSCLKKAISIVDVANLAGIGFSIPGPFDYKNGIGKFAGVPKFEKLNGINVQNEIRRNLELPKDIEIRFINDAIGFALGEDWAGKTVKHHTCMAIMIGEGFGSAFIRNSIPIIKGETVPTKGVVYNIPYNSGIADDYFSSRGLLNAYLAKGGMKFTDVKSLFKFSENDNNAKSVINDFGRNLAAFLLPIYKKFGAEVCVMGGSVAMHFPLFESSFNAFIQTQNSTMNVKVADVDDDSFILGGASLLIEDKWIDLLPILPELV